MVRVKTDARESYSRFALHFVPRSRLYIVSGRSVYSPLNHCTRKIWSRPLSSFCFGRLSLPFRPLSLRRLLFAQSGALPRRNRSAIRSADAPLISGYLLLIAGASPPAPPPPFFCSASADAMAITKVGAGVARSANYQAPPFGQGLVSSSGAWVLPRSPPLRSSVRLTPLHSARSLRGLGVADFRSCAQSFAKRNKILRYAP